MLPAEIVIVTDPVNGTTSMTYGSSVRSGNTTTGYYAPSPAGDLSGRPALSFSHETTKSGVVRSVVSFVTPVANGDGDSLGYIKTAIVVNRLSVVPLDLVELELYKAQQIVDSEEFRTAIAAMDL